MRLGVDLDNTIACYDGVFQRVAARQGWLPEIVGADKQAVRDQLRAAGRHEDWTRLQGLVYGPSMSEARPFPGVTEFLATALRNHWSVYVISHRTRHPYLGPPADLHEAARDWLRQAGITAATGCGLPEEQVYLEATLPDKLRRIGELACDVFVDDLPEVLLHEAFPATVDRICFDPADRCRDARLDCVGEWRELAARWFEREPQ